METASLAVPVVGAVRQQQLLVAKNKKLNFEKTLPALVASPGSCGSEKRSQRQPCMNAFPFISIHHEIRL